MINTIKHIEQLFGIELSVDGAWYVYDKPVSVEQANAVVEANPHVCWQDPTRPDCGNNDGILYLAISMTDEEGIECEPELFCFDNASMSFSIV